MKNNVKHILSNYLEWLKSDFILLISIIIISILVMKITLPIDIVRYLILIVLFIKCITFINFYSLTPSSNSAGDRFSWKFIQGLPINKIELLISLSISRVVLFFPLIFLVILNWSEVQAFINSISEWKDPSLFKFLLNSVLFLLISGVISVYSTITFPRVQYANHASTNKLLTFFKNLMLFVFGGIIFAALAYYLNKLYNINILSYFDLVLDYVIIISNSWYMPFVLILMLAYWFSSTLKHWVDEKKTYKKVVVNKKRDWAIVIIFGALNLIPFFVIDFKTPSRYRDKALIQAVYYKDHALIKKLATKDNVNIQNDHGFTPLLAAIYEGDLTTIQLLESYGARFEGKLNDKFKGHSGYDALMLAIDSDSQEIFDYIVSKGFSLSSYNEEAGFYPIHLVTARCRVSLLDQMIKQGIDVHVLNKQGQNPAIIASRFGCLANAIILKNAGANFTIPDHSGKKSIDYLRRDKKGFINKELGRMISKYSN